MFEKLKNLDLRERFLLIFITIFVIAISAVGYFGFTKTHDINYKLALSKDKEIVSTVANDLNTFIESVPKDLKFLVSSYSFNRYLLWESIGEKDSSHRRRNETIDSFVSFVNSKKYIYKVRFIDLKGDEQISIKYDRQKGSSEVIPIKELQNKWDRYYFKIPFKYKSSGIYVSNLDLNKEFGQFSYPYMPVVRFAMPIIDKSMTKHGVFVINVYADYFLDRIRKYKEQLSKEKREVYLVDNNGYYLFNKNSNKLWGKDLGHKISLKYENLELFNNLKEDDKGIYDDGNNLYTHEKIYPSKVDKSNYWILYTVTDKSYAFKDVKKFEMIFSSVILFIVIVVIILITRYISQITKPLSEVSTQLNILSKGRIPHKDVDYNYHDEISSMISSVKVLADSSSTTIKQAQLIASGDYSSNIKLLSDEDNLGMAINDMIKKLKTNIEKTQLNKWFSDGLGELSKILNAQMSFEDLANQSTSFICRYLEAGKGVFYILNRDKNSLILSGSFMHTSRDVFGDEYLVGEGSIGQVASEKKPILLKNVQDSINIALNDLVVENSYTFPLIYEDELYGVMEIMSVNEIDKKSQDFLNQAQDIIASILYSVEQRERIENLFEETKKSERELQVQSEELQDTNIQMQEQQQQLEEANAQMQEQQQQLEEANSQMQEQQQQLKENSKILEEKNKVLLKSQEELDKKADDLELSNKYKSEFLANMSHELRTPLNSIILLSDMLGENRDKHLSDDEIKKANIINSSGNELLRLINDVLDLSKVEAGKMELLIDKFDSAEFIEEIQDQFEHTANEKSLQFITIDEYKGKIINDKDRLSQIIRNLMSNSLKFTKEGSITFKIEKGSNGDVKLSVIDTGIGIPENKLKSIFGAFQQVDGGTSREYGGTGLGLSISKELVKIMGGDITLDSKEGEGSIFSIIIPNLETNASSKENNIKIDKKEDIVQQTIKDDRDNITAFNTPFLIIEDDKTFAEILKDKINASGDMAIIALNGKDGIELARQYNIRGVMLDLGLPDIDGIDVLKEFKTDMILRKIPVYIISGQDRDLLTKNCGAIGFTHKPVTNDGIEAVINKIKSFNDKEVKDLLIVEDNEAQREALIEFIGNGTIKSFGVESAQEAIEELNKGIYDSVIVDLKLKSGSGYEVCEHISKNNLQVPIIIYTGKNLTKAEETKLRKYTDSIIIKTATSQKRLLDEVDMFMHRVKVETGKKKENIDDISLNNKKILIVDDDIRNIYVLSEVLNSKGADVITASNGQEAIDILKDNLDTNIVLMDIMMPVMDGYEATKLIKANETTKDIPIIAVTAKAMKEDKQKALNIGCDDYVTKPLQMDLLVGIIKGWLNKK